MTVDIVLLLIFLFCILSGYRKGLIMALCTLLVLVLSCLGATAAKEALTPKAAEWLEPRLAAYVSEQMQEFAVESAGQAVRDAEASGIDIGGNQVDVSGIMGFLDNMGVDVQGAAEDTAEKVSQPLAETAAKAAAKVVVEAVAGGLIFCVSFLVIYLVLHSVALAVNLTDHLPVIHSLNHVGGAVIGLLTGAFFLTMAMALLADTRMVPEDFFGGPIAKLIQRIALTLMRR